MYRCVAAESAGYRAAFGRQTAPHMTQLDIELAALRARRRSPGFGAWLRRFAPFDRRAIRDPDARDVYWVNLKRRLAESDYESLVRHRASVSGPTSPEPV
jgi:hypothetical protein